MTQREIRPEDTHPYKVTCRLDGQDIEEIFQYRVGMLIWLRRMLAEHGDAIEVRAVMRIVYETTAVLEEIATLLPKGSQLREMMER